jgi:(R)-2-hydroxyacyl-CoA dehydratese activating ATPase
MICAGIDAGSRTLKIVLLDAQRLTPVASAVVDQGVDQDRLATELLERLMQSHGLRRDQLCALVGTGYGRKLLHGVDSTVTEITCQAWGVRHCLPEARTIIDIGGQDSKLVRMKADGAVADFVMNDRCAAGTGRFLEMMAAQLGANLTALGPLVQRSRCPATISNMCVVFAESEIVGLLSSGVPPEDILTGVEAAIATRISAMGAARLPTPIAFTGGVALVAGMDVALSSALGHPVTIAPQPQLTGALGAALLAARGLRQAL